MIVPPKIMLCANCCIHFQKEKRTCVESYSMYSLFIIYLIFSVLRALAGDPLAETPRYGLVSLLVGLALKVLLTIFSPRLTKQILFGFRLTRR